jgi:hypothetical protein
MMDKDQALTKFVSATGLTSLLGDPSNLPRTYDRGKRCIDFIMGTSKAYDSTIRSGMTEFYDRAFHSDHIEHFLWTSIAKYLLVKKHRKTQAGDHVILKAP